MSDEATSVTAGAFVEDLYSELRGIARRYVNRERAGHTLETTALVNEAYIRLSASARFPGRAEFLAAASRVMREILVDHARARSRSKRGCDPLRITLHDLSSQSRLPDDVDVLAIDRALARLESLDPEQVRIVEMRFFAGMSTEEVASVLGVSARTVSRDWAMARAWLKRELKPGV